MLQVRVGNVEFLGDCARGFLIAPDGFKGWEGAAGTRRNGGERVGQHGALDVPAFKSARLVTIAGHALADSEADLDHMEDVLSGVGQSTQQIVVQTATRSRWASGSVEGEIKFDRIGGAAEAAYQLSLFLPDPFKYGETRSTSATSNALVNAHHRGNTLAVPRIQVRGTFPDGYTLHSSDGIVQVSGSSSAIVDDLDMASGKFGRNGALNPRLMQIANFWTVPGGRVQPWRIELRGGAGTATQFLTDTYI